MASCIVLLLVVNVRWTFLSQIHRDFSWESVSERILKIGLHSHDCHLHL